jgi:uncharacterized protein (TIGR04255 family)
MVAKLPEFDAPPVIEVALDVQFQAIPELHGLRLAPLWDVWRADLPELQEQPPLAPLIEGGSGENVRQVEFITVLPQPRYWFLSADSTELVQLQQDRLAVNWRAVGDAQYPRYPAVRAKMEQRASEFENYLRQEGLTALQIIQAEISYVNAIRVDPDKPGDLTQLLRAWSGLPAHHLGEPGEVRLNLMFDVPELGKSPVRLHVAVSPGKTPNGSSCLFMNLTVRGNPGGSSVDDALSFIDGGHEHIVRSFEELTTEALHKLWRKRT